VGTRRRRKSAFIYWWRRGRVGQLRQRWHVRAGWCHRDQASLDGGELASIESRLTGDCCDNTGIRYQDVIAHEVQNKNKAIGVHCTYRGVALGRNCDMTNSSTSALLLYMIQRRHR